MAVTLTWVSQDHSDEPRDQQTDIRLHIWAEVGPEGEDGWSYTIMDFADENSILDCGFAVTEDEAKAAVEQWAGEHTIYADLLAQYDNIAGIESAMTESLNPAAAFLLVEESPLSGYWLTTHDSLEEAGAYFANQEDGSWQAKQLVDLRTGETYSAITTVTWKKES